MVAMYHKNNIKSIREKQGLPQIELSAKADVSLTTLSRLENGWIKLTDDVAAKLATALGVSPNKIK